VSDFELVVKITPNVTATVVVCGCDTVEVGSGRHTFTSSRVAAARDAQGG
jgi:hypothetical protein